MKDMPMMPHSKNLIYIAEERAFAPGIAGEWPKIIQKPKCKNGRLVGKIVSDEIMKLIEEYK